MDCSPPGSSVHAFQLNEARILSELPFPSPGDPLNPGIRPRSSTIQMDYLPSEPPWLLIPLGLRTKSLQQPTRSCMILETPLLTSSYSVITFAHCSSLTRLFVFPMLRICLPQDLCTCGFFCSFLPRVILMSLCFLFLRPSQIPLS